MRSLPTRLSSRRAASSSASGEGRWSGSRRSAIGEEASSIPGLSHLMWARCRRSVRFAPSTALSLGGVEGEIELEHVDARLAEQAEGPPLDVLFDQRADSLLR